MAYTIEYTGMEKDGKSIVISYNYDGKPSVKKIPSWTPEGKGIITVLNTSEAGEKFKVETAKKDGFVIWTSLTRTSGEADKKPENKVFSHENVQRYSGETSIERAKRQVYIIRQSSLSNAIEVLKHNAKDEKIETQSVLDLAEVMTNWVLETTELEGE